MRTTLGVLMQAAPVLVVACLVFLLIRTHLVEYYRIPSKSMAPTLHGDRENGDLVLVDKTAYWFKQPEPFDLVVVKVPPEDGSAAADIRRGNHIVKRMVVVGPASVTIREGDLFVGSVEGGAGDRVVKNPLTYADMRVPVFEYPRSNGDETFTDFFRVPPGLGGMQEHDVLLRAGSKDLASLVAAVDPAKWQGRVQQRDLDLHVAGHMSTRKAIDTSYLDPDGRGQPPGQAGYQADVGMSLRWTANAAVSGFHLVMEQRGGTVAVAYEVPGRGQLLVDGTTVGEPFAAPKVVAGTPVEVSFGYLDGHLFLIVAGELVLHRRTKLPAREDGLRENALHFGVAGKGGEVRIPAIVVFHDVHYLEDQARTRRLGGNVPYMVPKGHMFLLGDNTRDSHDSRDSEVSPFRLEHLVGRPFAVLAPTSRSRILPR
ncbi:MAG: signal peptidase I [Planctomycetota bacterium]|jgi:signal peptidase I